MLKRYGPLVPLFMLISFGLLGIVIGTACQRVPRNTPAPEPTSVAVAESVDLGNGVFYFPVAGDNYTAALVKFYEGNGRHCDMQGFTERVVIRGSGQNETQHTETTGFILHCHDIAIEAQEVTKE